MSEEPAESGGELSSEAESLGLLRAIHELAEALHHSLDPSSVVGRALQWMLEFSGAPSVALYLLEKGGKELVLARAVGQVEGLEADGHRVPVEGSITGLAVRRRELVVSQDLGTDERVLPQLRRLFSDRGFRTGLFLPILFENEVFGIINIAYRTPREISIAEREALRLVGKTIGLALASARQKAALAEEVNERRQAIGALRFSEAELHARNEFLETIQDITDRLVSTLDVRQVIEGAVEGIVRFSRSRSVALLLLDDRGEHLEIKHSQGPNIAGAEPGVRLPVQGSFSGIAVRERDVICTAEVATDDRLHPTFHQPMTASGVKSVASVPLIADDRVLGTVNILYKQARKFSEQEKDTLRAIGRTVGLAIANALHVEEIGAEIKERRRAETALRRSEERYRRLAENARDVIFRLALPSGDFEYLSPAAKQVFGLEQTEAYRSVIALLEIVHEEDRETVERWWNQVLEGETPEVLEYRVVDPRAQVRWLHQRNVLVRRDDGSPESLEGIITDLSDHRQAEEQKRQLQEQVQHTQKLESLGVLAGGIAHDFNNLLTGMLGNADLALRELNETSPACGYLRDLRTASERAAELCRQLLAYSGKGRFVVAAVDVNEVLREMTHLLELSISKKALCRFELADNLPAVEADVAQIRQVVMNLITNASEALEERSGVVRLATSAERLDAESLRATLVPEGLEPGLYVCIEVSDTGSGFENPTLDRIFDPFFITKFTGRGLGLAAVLGIVRGHRGTIEVSSTVGQGTAFRVFLPASPQGAALLAPPTPTEESWRGEGLVLLADDEGTVRLIGEKMLEHFGFEAMTARDGQEAVELFEQHADRIVLVVLDLTMPRMDGEEALRAMRRIRPSIRVLLSSGYNEQDVSSRFAGKGLAGFIQKPYRASALRDKIREVLGSPPPG